MAAAAEDGAAAAAATASLGQSSVGKPKIKWPTTKGPQTDTKREAAVKKKKKSPPDDCWHGRFCKTLECVFSHPDGRCLDQVCAYDDKCCRLDCAYYHSPRPDVVGSGSAKKTKQSLEQKKIWKPKEASKASPIIAPAQTTTADTTMPQKQKKVAFGEEERQAFHGVASWFIQHFGDFRSKEGKVGLAAFTMGEQLGHAQEIPPSLIGSVARKVTEASCVLLSPGADSFDKDTRKKKDITTKVGELEDLILASCGASDYDAMLPKLKKLKKLKKFGDVGSHHGKIHSDFDKSKILMALYAVATGVREHLFKLRAKLALDEAVFARLIFAAKADGTLPGTAEKRDETGADFVRQISLMVVLRLAAAAAVALFLLLPLVVHSKRVG